MAFYAPLMQITLCLLGRGDARTLFDMLRERPDNIAERDLVRRGLMGEDLVLKDDRLASFVAGARAHDENKTHAVALADFEARFAMRLFRNRQGFVVAPAGEVGSEDPVLLFYISYWAQRGSGSKVMSLENGFGAGSRWELNFALKLIHVAEFIHTNGVPPKRNSADRRSDVLATWRRNQGIIYASGRMAPHHKEVVDWLQARGFECTRALEPEGRTRKKKKTREISDEDDE